MPEVSRFFGIVITMYYNDHEPPHFHARYGGDHIRMAIDSGETLSGRFSPRARALARDWLEEHRDEVRENWRRARQRLPLARIAGLE